jgi:hypothetical protein
MKHKHAQLIKVWADGAEIEQTYVQQRKSGLKYWHSFDGEWSEVDDIEYRIKPAPKPDVVKLFQANYQCAFEVKPFDANLKLTWDGETGELKSAEVIK